MLIEFRRLEYNEDEFENKGGYVFTGREMRWAISCFDVKEVLGTFAAGDSDAVQIITRNESVPVVVAGTHDEVVIKINKGFREHKGINNENFQTKLSHREQISKIKR